MTTTRTITVNSDREMAALHLASKVRWYLDLWSDQDVSECQREDLESMRLELEKLEALF